MGFAQGSESYVDELEDEIENILGAWRTIQNFKHLNTCTAVWPKLEGCDCPNKNNAQLAVKLLNRKADIRS